MDTFKKLFGVEKSRIKPDCILSPLNEVDLFAGSRAGERARAKERGARRAACLVPCAVGGEAAAVHVAREHPRDIGHRLALPQPDLRGGKVHRVPAQLVHADVEANARAQ